ncbi:QWRF motif-containing protein 2-like [Zingiber officinale]|uniref:QWRF motif-containing protein 2-like n=1 Tax=Zingiber officinale TaxID=94328 RepID=UPI001C4C5506|nr:QWRF motif-containing protein 2-like [Zingiber officinale]
MMTAFLASSSSATSTGNYRSNSENPPPHHDESPLAPSVKKDNAATKRPRSKDVSSRYLAPSPTSHSTATVAPSSWSSSSSVLFPSPTVAQRCSVSPALNRESVEKRSQSVRRVNPLTPRTDSQAENSASARVQYSQTRSLSVSFQGEPFFYKPNHPKNTSFILLSKPSPERRLAGEVAVTPARDGNHSENSRPLVKRPRWPGAMARASNPLMRTLDCPSSRSHPILVKVQSLREPMVFGDGNQRSPVDGADLSALSDNGNMSSEGNFGAPQLGIPPVEVAPLGKSVPARFSQQTSSRQLRLPNSGLFLPPPSSSSTLQSELGLMRKLSVTNPSPFHRLIRSPSLSNYMATPSRGMASRVRSGTNVTVFPSDQPANAPSIISFAVEVRRSKKGENRIEKAHMLRLLDNRYVQWRFVNAKITATLLSKKVTAEKNIYDACITTSNLRDSVSFKRSKLHIMMDNLKLTSVLEGQITYLDEWSLMDTEHSNSLHGVVEALKATTVRLPIVHGAKAYIQDLKHAVGSAAEVMQAIGSSVCSMLSMVEGPKSIISEIAKVAVEERSLLNQSKDLLSAIAAMQVAQCSLHSHIMQLLPKSSHMQI